MAIGETSSRKSRVVGPVAALAILLAASLLAASGALSQVFLSRESALRTAFPGADEVVAHDLVLTPEEADRIASRAGAGAALDSRLITAYEGRTGGESLGWALIDTHTIRSLPQTVLVVIAPDGRIASTLLLAFHEPEQYRAPARWFEQFRGLPLNRDLAVGRSVDGVSGATMTSHSATAAARRALAVWEEKLASPEVGLAAGIADSRS